MYLELRGQRSPSKLKDPESSMGPWSLQHQSLGEETNMHGEQGHLGHCCAKRVSAFLLP